MHVEPQDFGYVQGTSTEVLKSYVFNEPIIVKPSKAAANFKARSTCFFSFEAVVTLVALLYLYRCLYVLVCLSE